MNEYEYEVWGDPGLAAFATLLGAEREPPMLAGPAAPGSSSLLDVMEIDGRWVPEYDKWCDVYSVGKTYPLAAVKWHTIGNVELRGEEFVFSADGPADGYIATKVTVPGGSHFRFSFEAGYYGNRTNAYGTQVAFRVAAAIDNVPVAAARHEEPAGGPKDHRRPQGFAFKVPGSGDVEVELRFHDLTNRDGAARDLRIMPQVAVAVGRVSAPVVVWADTSGKYDKRYYSTPEARSTLYRVRGDIEECGEVRDGCPSYRSGVMCDRWWDIAAKQWRDEQITVWAEIPCEGGFSYAYEKGGDPRKRGSGEPYELRSHIVDCDIPEPPDPSECPTDEFYSCQDITRTGTVTYSRHLHIPCEGEVIDQATYKGKPYKPAGLVRCEEVDTIEEARKREGEEKCPAATPYSCKDVTGDKTITHTKWAITTCDGGTQEERRYGGDPYELQGDERDCVEVENREEAEKREKTEDCPVTHTQELCDRRTMWVLQDGWKFSDGVTGPDAGGYYALGADEPGGDYIEATVTPSKPGGKSWFNFRTLALGEGTGGKKPYVRFKIEIFDGDTRLAYFENERTGSDYKTVGYSYTAPKDRDVRVRLTDITTAEDASKGELVGLRARPHGQERRSEYRFLRHVTTACDGTKGKPRDTTAHGVPYSPAGAVGKCGECGTSSKWFTCVDGDTRYVKEAVYDCDGELVETHRTLNDEPYEPSADPEECTETSEEEAKRRQGEVECPNRSEWYTCKDTTSSGTVTFVKETVLDCNGQHITTNRTYQGSTYTPVAERDCVKRGNEAEARKHEGKEPCPRAERSTCREVTFDGTRTVNFKNWKISYATAQRFSDGPGGYVTGGRPYMYSPYRWDYAFGLSGRSRNLAIMWNEPTHFQFDITRLSGEEWVEIPEGIEPVEVHEAHKWVPSDRRIRANLDGRHSRYGELVTSTFRTTRPLKRMLLEGSPLHSRSHYHSITNLKIAKSVSTATVTKIVTTPCDGRPQTTYEKGGHPYELKGVVGDCRPE